ncbi:serine/threonine protein kinase, partial [Hepatocystis sp. ex Piliocolobus tephrosceles]
MDTEETEQNMSYTDSNYASDNSSSEEATSGKLQYSESDDEGSDEYCEGGYHPVKVDEIYNNRYRIEGKLGWGHFSTVWVATDLKSKPLKYVAVKFQKGSKPYIESAKYEINYLKTVKVNSFDPSWVELKEQQRETLFHYNMTKGVVSFIDSFEHHGPNGTHICMVFEFMGPNLLSLIKYYDYKGIPLNLVRKIATHVLIGLEYLHDVCKIIHTDIKPENVLVSPLVSIPRPRPVGADETETNGKGSRRGSKKGNENKNEKGCEDEDDYENNDKVEYQEKNQSPKEKREIYLTPNENIIQHCEVSTINEKKMKKEKVGTNTFEDNTTDKYGANDVNIEKEVKKEYDWDCVDWSKLTKNEKKKLKAKKRKFLKKEKLKMEAEQKNKEKFAENTYTNVATTNNELNRTKQFKTITFDKNDNTDMENNDLVNNNIVNNIEQTEYDKEIKCNKEIKGDKAIKYDAHKNDNTSTNQTEETTLNKTVLNTMDKNKNPISSNTSENKKKKKKKK